MSAAHPQLPSLSLKKKKKKIRVATFHHAGEAIKDLKKFVSLKRSVRISSGDRTWCQKRHLCCVTHSISFACSRLKAGVGYGGDVGGGACGEVDTAGPPCVALILDTLCFPLPKVT